MLIRSASSDLAGFDPLTGISIDQRGHARTGRVVSMNGHFNPRGLAIPKHSPSGTCRMTGPSNRHALFVLSRFLEYSVSFCSA